LTKVEGTEGDKYTSLLRTKLVTSVKSFVVQNPGQQQAIMM